MSTWRDVLICTVGTSLKSNLERQDDPDFRKDLDRGYAKGLAKKLLEQKPDNRLCGAEINSVSSIIKQRYLNDTVRLLFLVSDTPDGKFLGEVLRQYYGQKNNSYHFQKVEVQSLKGLTDADSQLFRTEGLRNLVRAISQVVQEVGSERIVINATGGYKAQISFAGMIGQALEIPVCYLFERFSEVIELPPQPISMDLTFWLENVDTFYVLATDEAEDNPAQNEPRFATLVDEITIDGRRLIGLSPVGQLFHEMFRHRLNIQRPIIMPPDSGLTASDKDIKFEDENKGKHLGLATYLDRIRDLPYVKRIYTYYYNPDLPKINYFRRSSSGDNSHVEGGYSDGKATTKFDVVTTAVTASQRDVVIADLMEKIANRY